MAGPEPRVREAVEPTERGAEPECNKPSWENLDRMLEELPPGIPILPPEDACDFSKYRDKPRAFAKGEAWRHCNDTLEEHVSHLCKHYREEIDTLLVFAGLFSAVVTGFTIDSYKWLQNDPDDAIVSLLTHIAQSVGPNNTILAATYQTPSGMPRSTSMRINVYWFMSLSLSLSAALVSILGRQWVREFESSPDLSPKEAIGVRQVKHEGFMFWKVGEIISALPLLLQLSLALFAVGVLELLWHLQPALAISVTIPTVLVALFYLVTTVLPSIQYSRRFLDNPQWPQCAYKSPQAMLALRFYQIAAEMWRLIGTQIQRRIGVAMHDACLPDSDALWGVIHTWDRWDIGHWLFDGHLAPVTVPILHFRGLRTIFDRHSPSNAREAAWMCLWEEAHSRDPDLALAVTRSSADQDLRLRLSILDVGIKSSPGLPPLRTCAFLALPRVFDVGFVPECVIHNFCSLDIATADGLLDYFKFTFPQDPTLVTSLLRAVVSFSRLHIRDDLVPLILRVSVIVARCWDPMTRLALQFILVNLTRNWIRLRGLPRESNPAPELLAYVLDEICCDPVDFVQHPDRVRSLDRVKDLATLVRTCLELAGVCQLRGPCDQGSMPPYESALDRITASLSPWGRITTTTGYR